MIEIKEMDKATGMAILSAAGEEASAAKAPKSMNDGRESKPPGTWPRFFNGSPASAPRTVAIPRPASDEGTAVVSFGRYCVIPAQSAATPTAGRTAGALVKMGICDWKSNRPRPLRKPDRTAFDMSLVYR